MRVGAKAPLAGSGLQELTKVNSEDHDREERTRQLLASVLIRLMPFLFKPPKQLWATLCECRALRRTPKFACIAIASLAHHRLQRRWVRLPIASNGLR